jgi:fibronectin type 3 domain-containing protein
MLESSSAKTNQPEMWTFRYREADPKRVSVAPPSDVQIVTNAKSATLSWKPSSTSGIKAYHIYRAQADEPWKAALAKIAEVPASVTQFDDKNLERGQTYFYAVKAIADSGESGFSFRARTSPPVPNPPVVSVAKDRVVVKWDEHPAKDIVGYNLYRGIASVAAVKKGEPKAWRDNDPEYASPQVVKVNDITRIERLNDKPLTETTFTDKLDLTAKPLNDDYAFGVYAYIVRAVNQLGVESGPSPYALTIPSEPLNLLCREQGKTAELKWDANPEGGITGYHVNRLKGTWEIERVTKEPVKETTYRDEAGNNTGRYWVVAIDALGQEGQPSSPAWFNRSFKGFYEGEWHQ